jgi:hypothetical protein
VVQKEVIKEGLLGEIGDVKYIKDNLKEEVIKEIKKPILIQDTDKHYKSENK